MTDREKVLNSYVTDMLALEEHIQKAVKAQQETFDKEHPEVAGHLRSTAATIQQHIDSLKALDQGQDGSSIGEALKRAGTLVASLGAAAIDVLRTEKLAKDLRDDFTAGSLAYIGYVMLLTTARSLGDERVAMVAEVHMTDYARINMSLSELIPGSVMAQLREDGLQVNQQTANQVNDAVRRVWDKVSA